MTRIIIILSAIFLLNPCWGQEEKKSCCAKKNQDKCEKSAENFTPSDESIYLLNSEWENQKGEKVKLSSFSGKLVVAAMIFTHCPSACPRIVADLKIIESELNDREKNSIQFLLISMDPVNDHPARMKSFMKDFQLGENWTMIRSDQLSTMEMANVLGVRIKPLAGGGFDHSNTIFIINHHGEITSQQHGLKIDTSPSVNNIRKLIR